MKSTRISNHAHEQLDATPPERITLHVYTIERNGLPRVVAVCGRHYAAERLLQGNVVIEHANGRCTYLAEGTVSRVDYTTKEITLDAIN